MIRVERFLSNAEREEAWSGKVRLNGHAFDHGLTGRSADSIRYPKSGVELNLLMNGLSPCGDDPSLVETVKPSRAATPDFKLEIQNRIVYCECTSAGDPQSFTWQLTTGDWQHRLVRALENKPEILERLGNRYVGFVPSRLPSLSDIPELVRDSIRFISDENLATLSGRHLGTRVPQRYPALSNLDTVIASSTSEHPYAFVQMPATTTGGPTDAVAQLHAAFVKKVRRNYGKFRPLWLVIGATEIVWTLSDVAESLARLLTTLQPFERLYVATSRESFRFSEACEE